MIYNIQTNAVGQFDGNGFPEIGVIGDISSFLASIHERASKGNNTLSYCLQIGEKKDETRLCWFLIYEKGNLVFSLSGSIHKHEEKEEVENEWHKNHPDFLTNSTLLSSDIQCVQYEKQVCLFCDTWFFSGTIEQEMEGWQKMILLPQ